MDYVFRRWGLWKRRENSRDPRFGLRRLRSGTGGEAPRRYVNADMDWEKVPGCELGGVLDAIMRHILS